MLPLLLLFCCFSFCIQAQYEGIYEVPLPKEFSQLKKGLIIYSTPNPNYPEFADAKQEEVVWKHRTVIKATETITIQETGAYLLNNGTWMKRATFNQKQTKEFFNSKNLTLKKGDSIVYENNWRYDRYTATGWNFWYVKAVNEAGQTIYGYDILETKGTMADGTQVLLLQNKNSVFNWSGKASDSDYTLAGKMTNYDGTLVVQNEVLKACNINIQMKEMQQVESSLINHLQNKDFFHVKKFPIATFKSTTIEAKDTNKYLVTGQLCIIGTCQTETWEIELDTTDKTYDATFKLTLDRTRYGMLYGSSKSKEFSIADEIKCWGRFSFRKDYPGSMPWNNLSSD